MAYLIQYFSIRVLQGICAQEGLRETNLCAPFAVGTELR
jgi:hypothetical protein